MLRNTDSRIITAAAVLLLGIAAAAAFFSALPHDRILAAAGAAFFLFTFTEINRVLSPARSHLLVSGEIPAAATSVIAVGVFAAGAHPVIPAGIFLIFSAFMIFKGNNIKDMFLTGILALLIFTIAASFLILKNSLDPETLVSILTGSHFTVQSEITASAAAAAAILAAFLSPRFAGTLSSVSTEVAPVHSRLFSITLTLLRSASIFAAFILSGSMIFPIDSGDNVNRFRQRFNILTFYISIALITSSASSRGWGIPVLAVLLSASYVRFYFALRRSRHARYQRSFIHGQRNSNS